MQNFDALSRRLDLLESRLALSDLATAYAVSADTGDRDRWWDLWTDDAVWDTGGDEEHVYRGRERICWAVRQQWAAFPRMQHAISNHTVVIDGDRAEGRCDVVLLLQLPDQRWLLGGGTYVDSYVRHDHTWRISRRQVERPFDLASLPGTLGGLHREDPAGEPG